MTVPAPMETVGMAAPPPRLLKFRCPSCRRKFATKPDLAGQKIRCNKCGAGVRVPWADEEANIPAPQFPAKAYFGNNEATAPARPPRVDLLRADVPRADVPRVDVPLADSPRADIPRVDVARADIPRVDVARVEVRSGHHEAEIVSPPELADIASLEGTTRRRAESVLSSRSELMEQVRQQVAEEEAVATQKPVEKAGKKRKQKKKKHSSFFDPKETLKLVAGVGALVALLAFLACGYPEFRFPLGGFLCVIGFIVYLLGSASLRQLVAEEGALKALMFRFCPPYQWWFVATHWVETRDFVAFFVAGALVMSLGAAIIKTSPTGKKAEASERAYQKLLTSKEAEAPPAVTNGGVVDHD